MASRTIFPEWEVETNYNDDDNDDDDDDDDDDDNDGDNDDNDDNDDDDDDDDDDDIGAFTASRNPIQNLGFIIFDGLIIWVLYFL